MIRLAFKGNKLDTYALHKSAGIVQSIYIYLCKVRNEKSETKEELRDRSGPKLMTSADNSLMGAIEDEDIALGEINTRHER